MDLHAFDVHERPAPAGAGHPTAQDDRLEDVQRRLGDVLLGERDVPVDLRAYLLDPPPTAEQAARDERRRLLVRRGSIGVAAGLAVALLAPWPGGGSGRSGAPVRAAAPVPLDSAVATTPGGAEPTRVDAPVPRAAPVTMTARARATRVAARARALRVARQRRGARARARARAVAARAVAARTSAPAPAAAAAAPTPAIVAAPSRSQWHPPSRTTPPPRPTLQAAAVPEQSATNSGVSTAPAQTQTNGPVVVATRPPPGAETTGTGSTAAPG